MNLLNNPKSVFSVAAVACFAMAGGCENKEPIVDVETPAGEVEVERDRDTGAVDVEVTDNE